MGLQASAQRKVIKQATKWTNSRLQNTLHWYHQDWIIKTDAPNISKIVLLNPDMTSKIVSGPLLLPSASEEFHKYSWAIMKDMIWQFQYLVMQPEKPQELCPVLHRNESSYVHEAQHAGCTCSRLLRQRRNHIVMLCCVSWAVLLTPQISIE